MQGRKPHWLPFSGLSPKIASTSQASRRTVFGVLRYSLWNQEGRSVRLPSTWNSVPFRCSSCTSVGNRLGVAMLRRASRGAAVRLQPYRRRSSGPAAAAVPGPEPHFKHFCQAPPTCALPIGFQAAPPKLCGPATARDRAGALGRSPGAEVGPGPALSPACEEGEAEFQRDKEDPTTGQYPRRSKLVFAETRVLFRQFQWDQFGIPEGLG